MRYLVIGLAAVIAMGAICVFSGVTIERKIDEMTELLTRSETAYNEGDRSAALEYAKQALERWEKCQGFFDTTLPGVTTIAAEQQISVVVRLLETNSEEAASKYSEVIEGLKLISEGEKLTIGNIL